MSCRTISNAELAKTIPVKPPTVNKNKNPKTHRTGASIKSGVPCIDASQEKILIPVGTAMTIVAEVK